jgi:hypothetical protein
VEDTKTGKLKTGKWDCASFSCLPFWFHCGCAALLFLHIWVGALPVAR